jgi:hypothetical protein
MIVTVYVIVLCITERGRHKSLFLMLKNLQVSTFFILIVLWGVDPLLGNDRQVSCYTTTVAR